MLILKRLADRRRQMTALCVAATIVVATAVFAIVAAAQTAPPTLQSILPQDSVIAGSVQSDWLWTTTASLRAIPQVSKAISDMNTQSGMSFENDVQPWAGQIGVSFFNPTKDDANVAVYVEIKDPAKFAVSMVKLQTEWKNPPADAKPGTFPQFATRDYNGTTVYDATQKPTYSGPHADKINSEPVSFAILNGWAIMGIGKGAIEHALDVYQGKFPSMASSATWSSVIGNLPAGANGWVGLDVPAILKASQTASTQVPGAMANSFQAAVGFAITDEGNGLRFDAVSSPLSDKAKAMYANMAHALPPVSGDILTRVPDAVFAAMFTNPSYYWTLIKTSMLDTATSADQRKQMEAGLKQAASVEATVPYFHKDAGLVLTWRKDRGFGLVLLAHADSHEAALHAASAIATSLKQLGIPLERGGSSWATAIPGLDMMVPPTVPVKLEPFMSAKDDWLVVGSSPSWTASTSTPNLQMPASASGAPIVYLAKMNWLPPLLDVIEQQAPAGNTDAKQGFAIVRGLHLENSEYTSVCHFDPAGTWSTGTSEITGWDWHSALDNTVSAIENWKSAPAPANPAGHDLLKPDATTSTQPSASAGRTASAN